MNPDKWRNIPQLPQAHYQVDVEWSWVETQLKGFQGSGGLNLDPDYQREHVWTPAQQVSYIEYILSGGEVGKVLTFNSPGWPNETGQPIELIDGKQRLEAVRAFIRGDILAYGMKYEPGDHLGSGARCRFHWRVCSLKTREEILRLYLNINAGGTPHTREEIDRVRGLLKKAKKTR